MLSMSWRKYPETKPNGSGIWHDSKQSTMISSQDFDLRKNSQAFWRSTMKSWNLWFIGLTTIPPAHQHIQPIHSFLFVMRRCHLAQSHERAPHRDPHPCRWTRNVGCLTKLRLGVQNQLQNWFVNFCRIWRSFHKCSLNFAIPGKQRTYRSQIIW